MEAKTARARGRPRSTKEGAEDASAIKSLDRGIEVLKCVAAATGLSLTEVAAASNQAAPTAYRVLMTLQKHRLVEFNQSDQLWYIGLGAFQIGSTFLTRTRIAEQSRPAMQQLMLESSETSNLAVVDRDEIVFISQVETHEPIRAFFRPGTRGPLHASGIGKALMAYFPEERIASILSRPLVSFTPKTLNRPDLILEELARVRARGWAVDDEENTLGMRGVAAPIFNQFGEAVAGVSLSGPSARVTPDLDKAYGARVAAAAMTITAAIGGTQPR